MTTWLVEDWYHQNGFHLLGGPVGSGKTGLEIGLMAAAFRGEPWLGKQTTKPTKWVQLVSDRGLDNRSYWANQYGIELPGPHETYVIADHPHDCPNQEAKTVPERMKYSTEWLRNKLRALEPEPGGVVTIDVATPFFPPSQADYATGFWAGQKMKAALGELPSCYLMLSHGSKYNRFTSASRLVDRIIGNTGILGVMDSLSYIGTKAEAEDMRPKLPDACQVFSIVPRMSEEVVLALRRDRRGRLLLDQSKAPAENLGGAPRKLTLDGLVSYFTDEPQNRFVITHCIAEQEEVSNKTVSRRFDEAITELLIEEVDGMPNYWIRASGSGKEA
jgi:hypothetical protein